MSQRVKWSSVFFIVLSIPLLSYSLVLTSNDIAQNEFMGKAQEFSGFGCLGSDLSPHLKWSDIPLGTKSFAVTVYDPDAPTESGWWHWIIANIPVSVTELSTGMGSTKANIAPEGSMQIKNDYGSKGFGGVCPPPGNGIHHYRFRIHAISVKTLAISESASAALASYLINALTIESSVIEALYKRN